MHVIDDTEEWICQRRKIFPCPVCGLVEPFSSSPPDTPCLVEEENETHKGQALQCYTGLCFIFIHLDHMDLAL